MLIGDKDIRHSMWGWKMRREEKTLRDRQRTEELQCERKRKREREGQTERGIRSSVANLNQNYAVSLWPYIA